MSTRTFGASFTGRLLSETLAIFHVQVTHHTFELVQFGMRKLGHFTEYAIFSLFLYHAISADHRSVWDWRKALACIVLAGLYSLTDEFHQRFVPGRGPSIVDCGFDTIGATLGMIVLYFGGEGRVKLNDETPGSPGGNNSSPS
ncbi:MAG: VanZ family protein [Acidobacteriota bacterium]